jgi:hypothetical protein
VPFEARADVVAMALGRYAFVRVEKQSTNDLRVRFRLSDVFVLLDPQPIAVLCEKICAGWGLKRVLFRTPFRYPR